MKRENNEKVDLLSKEREKEKKENLPNPIAMG
jgi:hypothetical protein